MGFEIVLARFDEKGGDSPKHPAVQADLLRAAQGVVAGKGTISLEAGGFVVQLDQCSGQVRANHASFECEAPGRREMRLIYEIARTGDMVVMLEGGKYRAILTDARQRGRLPADWIGDDEETPTATSPTHLATLMRGALEVQGSFRERVAQTYQPAGPSATLNPSPWRAVDPRRRVYYLQARRRERPITLFNRWFKYYEAQVLPRATDLLEAGILVPAGGTMWGFEWTVSLPSGESFYGFASHGDHEGWLSTLRAFAEEEGRILAAFEGEGERFVCDDGRTYLRGEYSYRPQTADD
jgi:hypothetical protein